MGFDADLDDPEFLAVIQKRPRHGGAGNKKKGATQRRSESHHSGLPTVPFRICGSIWRGTFPFKPQCRGVGRECHNFGQGNRVMRKTILSVLTVAAAVTAAVVSVLTYLREEPETAAPISVAAPPAPVGNTSSAVSISYSSSVNNTVWIHSRINAHGGCIVINGGIHL